MNKKISVIVPIYNSSITLDRTLNSIVNQTYIDLEIILVNDGSTDNSLEICKKYVRRDNRIIIVNQKNKGVSEARNHGIDVSTGDFISFVDSDDILDLDFFEKLHNNFEIFNSDIVVSNVRCITNDSEFFPYKSFYYKKECSKKQFIKMLLNFEFGNAVWGKLFTKKCIKNVKFKNIDVNEDFIFFWDAILRAKKFSFNFETYYGYCIDTNKSLTKNGFNKDNMFLIEHIEDVKDFVKCNYPNLINDLINYYNAMLLHNLVIYYNYICTTNNNNLYLDEIKEMLNKTKNIKKINNYFLISEQNIDIDILLANI